MIVDTTAEAVAPVPWGSVIVTVGWKYPAPIVVTEALVIVVPVNDATAVASNPFGRVEVPPGASGDEIVSGGAVYPVPPVSRVIDVTLPDMGVKIRTHCVNSATCLRAWFT